MRLLDWFAFLPFLSKVRTVDLDGAGIEEFDDMMDLEYGEMGEYMDWDQELCFAQMDDQDT